MSSINDLREQVKKLMWDLRSLIDKGNWPEIDSKPYSLLLCENVIRMLEELDLAEPRWVTGKKRKLCDDDDDDQCFSYASSSNTAMPKKNLTMNCEDGLEYRKNGSKEIKNENYPRTNREKFEDGFEWRNCGTKKIGSDKQPSDYSSYSKATKSKRVDKKNPQKMAYWIVVENEKDEDGLKWRKHGSKKIQNENNPRLNWIVVEKEKAEDGLKWRKCGSKKTKNGNYPGSFFLLFPPTPLPGGLKTVEAARPLQTISPNGTLCIDIETTRLVRRSARNMCSDEPKNTTERITKRGRVRALEDNSAHSTARQVSMISPLGSVHIPFKNPDEGISDEQIMEITIQCGITLSSSRTGVDGSLMRVD